MIWMLALFMVAMLAGFMDLARKLDFGPSQCAAGMLGMFVLVFLVFLVRFL